MYDSVHLLEFLFICFFADSGTEYIEPILPALLKNHLLVDVSNISATTSDTKLSVCLISLFWLYSRSPSSWSSRLPHSWGMQLINRERSSRNLSRTHLLCPISRIEPIWLSFDFFTVLFSFLFPLSLFIGNYIMKYRKGAKRSKFVQYKD